MATSASKRYGPSARARACDFCRRRKIKCIPSKDPGSEDLCTSCVEFGIKDCTYVQPTGRKQHSEAYVKSLEQRVHDLEGLIEKKLALSRQHDEPPPYPASSRDTRLLGFPPVVISSRCEELGHFFQASSTPVNDVQTSQTKINGRYFGPSSGVGLLNLACEVGELDEELTDGSTIIGGFFKFVDSSNATQAALAPKPRIAQFLPPLPRLRELVEIYDRSVAPFWPIIHRSTLHELIQPPYISPDGRTGPGCPMPASSCEIFDTMPDAGQINLLMMVCAIAELYEAKPKGLDEFALSPSTSRSSDFSEEARQAMEREREMQKTKPPGWSYFIRVRDTKKNPINLLPLPELVDLQMCALGVLYLWLVGESHAAWLNLGGSIRRAQDIGAHRFALLQNKEPLEAEMLKRVFWCFVLMDTSLSSKLGHTVAVHEEDHDLEFPNASFEEDDDEERRRIEYFNQMLQLNAHLTVILRLLYSARSDAYKRWGFATAKDTVTHIDAGLERWRAALPLHFQWEHVQHQPLSAPVVQHCAELLLNFYYIKLIAHRAIDTAFSSSDETEQTTSHESSPNPTNAFVPLSINDVSGQAAREFSRLVAEVLKLQSWEEELDDPASPDDESSEPGKTADPRRRLPLLYFPPTMSQALHAVQLILFVRLWMTRQRPWNALVKQEEVDALAQDYEVCLENVRAVSKYWGPTMRLLICVNLLYRIFEDRHSGAPRRRHTGAKDSHMEGSLSSHRRAEESVLPEYDSTPTISITDDSSPSTSLPTPLSTADSRSPAEKSTISLHQPESTRASVLVPPSAPYSDLDFGMQELSAATTTFNVTWENYFDWSVFDVANAGGV